MARKHDIPFWRGIALILACFAVSLRVAVPVGFMPGIAADGRAGLVLCTPSSSSHQQPVDPAQTAADQHCVFAGAGAAPVEAADDVSAYGTFVYAPVVFGAWRDLAPGLGLTAPPPPAIGPPLRDV